TTSDSFSYSVADPTGNTLAGQTFSITVTAVNDAPVNTIPGLQSIPEDTPLTFSTAGGNAVSVADDAGAGDIIKVTLSIGDNASLTLTGISGASLTAWSVTPGTANWVLEGTVAQINAEMDGMIFTPGGDFVGTTTLRIQTEDQGNTGLGGAQTDTDTISIDVTPQNDAPVLTGDLSATVNEGATYTITGTDLGYSDPDDVDAGITFTTSAASNGKIQVNGSDASSFTGTQLTAGQVTFIHDGSET
ncbi:MAG: hypothetical protein GY722_08660, partial [bacterium]|nr:hypothetical protein [bacterium]